LHAGDHPDTNYYARPCSKSWVRLYQQQRTANCAAAVRETPSFLYRIRNAVERFFNARKHFKAVATPFEKRDANYLALVKLAASRIWIRFMSR
jgi:transposase